MEQSFRGLPQVPSQGPERPRWNLRQIPLAVVCVLSAALMLAVLNEVYPVRKWLAAQLFVMWGWLAVLQLACLSMGARITVGWLRTRDRPVQETLALSMAAGVVAWVLAMYLLGAFDLYGSPAFYLLAAAFSLAGIAPLAGLLRRWQSTRIASPTETAVPGGTNLVKHAVIAFGTVCLGLMYLQLFSPAALNYDSVWCHLTVAEAYARERGIVPFPADYAKNVPQLTPLIHLWGFVVPGLSPPLRWMFALHNEFALFLWTLVGVEALVAWIIGDRRRVSTSWAAFFLFPGIFVYDSNLGGAADHILAFFAPPLALAAIRLAQQPGRGKAILFGGLAGGALLTKYQAVYFLVPVVGLLAVRSIWDCLRRARRHNEGLGPSTLNEMVVVAGIALLTLTLVVSPHFLRNFLFYRNPVYPFMQNLFTASSPRVADGAYLVSHIFTDRNWQPAGTLLEKVRNAVVLFFTFSFKPHYYYEFHRNVPSFGSLFTLSLPVIPLLGRQPRLWWAVVAASGAVVLWAMTFLVDRNLQTFLPLLVAPTAATIILVWNRGLCARLGIAALVLLQVVWGADALFYSGNERLRSALDIISSGFRGTTSSRFDNFQAGNLAMGQALPSGATVLLRGSHAQLGINRRVMLDWAGFQGLIDYRTVGSVGELDALFRRLGITHVARPFSQWAGASKQEDVLIAMFLSLNAQPAGSFGSLELFSMPPAPLAPLPAGPVLMVGVAGFPDGAYPLSRLGIYDALPGLPHAAPVPAVALPTDPQQRQALVRAAMATVVGEAGAVPAGLLTVVEQHQTRMRISPSTLQIFARK